MGLTEADTRASQALSPGDAAVAACGGGGGGGSDS
eukprot:CAMPEP_0171935226 /NCGR_PEP_ID=MMETSP0993-20121228/32711_1 /TAXON_ID=483369 /ORGANISM="non described non described, Strain CCMP2098" /LENGTH=34 /DNA_ID= /DNA_START= /DNA_END= /DNA_ORIENTATION=